MSSYAYCEVCQAGLAQPTLREAVEGLQFCREGHRNHLRHREDALVYALEGLEERIQALEDRVKTADLFA